MIQISPKNVDLVYAVLKKCDFSEKEIFVYLTILTLGRASVSQIAKKTNLPRPTAYIYISKLLSSGLLYETKKKNKRYIIAEPPESIHMLIKNEEEKIQKIKKQAIDVVESLNQIIPKNIEKQRDSSFKYYEGVKDIDTFVYEEALSCNEIYSFLNIKLMFSMFPKNMERYLYGIKKKVFIKHLINNPKEECQKELMELQNEKKYMCKFFPDEKSSRVDYIIYEKKLAIISFKQTPTAIIINDNNIIEAAKKIFLCLWEKI